jgi:hypothetical protein
MRRPARIELVCCTVISAGFHISMTEDKTSRDAPCSVSAALLQGMSTFLASHLVFTSSIHTATPLIFQPSLKLLFDCIRVLGPVLHETPINIAPHPWAWSDPVYAPVLRAVITATTNTTQYEENKPHLENMATLRSKIMKPLEVVMSMKVRLPTELSDAVFGWLPPCFALALELLSTSCLESCLRQFRRDPIARRFEHAYLILSHQPETHILWNRIMDPVEFKMPLSVTLTFIKAAGKYYLQSIATTGHVQESIPWKLVERIVISHNRNCTPYIAVQVNDFGITHIAFESEGGRPKWVSPNPSRRPSAFFFQDQSQAAHFDSIFIISDASGFHLLFQQTFLTLSLGAEALCRRY